MFKIDEGLFANKISIYGVYDGNEVIFIVWKNRKKKMKKKRVQGKVLGVWKCAPKFF